MHYWPFHSLIIMKSTFRDQLESFFILVNIIIYRRWTNWLIDTLVHDTNLVWICIFPKKVFARRVLPSYHRTLEILILILFLIGLRLNLKTLLMSAVLVEMWLLALERSYKLVVCVEEMLTMELIGKWLMLLHAISLTLLEVSAELWM